MRVSSLSFYDVPVIGWMVRDAVHGSADAKYFFIFNVAVLFGAAIYVFGYPFVISLALLATGSAITFLVVLTGSDAFAKDRPVPVQPQVRHPRRNAAAQQRHAA